MLNRLFQWERSSSATRLRRRDRWRSQSTLLFRPHIVLGAGISDAPPRSLGHADWLAHLGSDRRPAADFRYVVSTNL